MFNVFPDGRNDRIKETVPYYLKERIGKPYEIKEETYHVQQINDISDFSQNDYNHKKEIAFSKEKFERIDGDGIPFFPKPYEKLERFHFYQKGIVFNYKVTFELDRYFPFSYNRFMYKETRKYEIIYCVCLFLIDPLKGIFQPGVFYIDKYDLFSNVFYKKYTKEAIENFEKILIEKAMKEITPIHPDDQEHFFKESEKEFGKELD